MAGLLNQQTNVATEEAATNVTPEEQEQYNQFVTNGMQAMYDEKSLPQMLQAIQGDGNPVEGLANALVMLVTRLEDSAEQAGQKISGDVMLHGGTELLEQMADLSKEAGMHDFNKQELEEALYTAMDLYRGFRQEQGKLEPEPYVQDIQALQAAEESGNVDDVMPGLTEFAKKMPKGKGA